jgi:hypothetical protein
VLADTIRAIVGHVVVAVASVWLVVDVAPSAGLTDAGRQAGCAAALLRKEARGVFAGE